MTAIDAWGERLTPAFGDTLRRFPLPVALAALAAAIVVYALNSTNSLVPEDIYVRATAGVVTAAIFATAGIFFAESRPQGRIGAPLLIYVVPVVAGLLIQIHETVWVTPVALPLIGALWLSVSAHLGGPREELEPRFWWLNHRAIATAAIAGVALGMIVIGFIAIERTVQSLFGLDAGTLVYRIMLPVICLFFAPVYWLSTLPRLSDFDPRALTAPDFLARAVGLVGKFILIPLLLAYAGILLLYVAQIVLTRQLPQGMLGWMVTGFVVAGAAAWLVLYPPFARDSLVVRVFLRVWFWLTLLPLALFFYAVWVRIDAYGLTPERLVLVWVGVWASLLALAFLFGRRDIRLIPGLAAAILLVATIGPWNLENLPRWQQGTTLDLLLSKPGPNGQSLAGPAAWTEEERQRASGAVAYLGWGDAESRAELVRILGRYGYDFDLATLNPPAVLQALTGEESDAAADRVITTLRRDYVQGVDVSATPILLTRIDLFSPGAVISGDLTIEFDNRLWMRRGSGALVPIPVPLPPVAAGGRLADPVVDFSFEGADYRLVIDEIGYQQRPDGGMAILRFAGTLFTQSP